MKLSLGPLSSLALLALSVLVVGGCAPDVEAPTSADSAESEHEDFPPTESMKNLAYGETEWADHPAIVPYRAFTLDVREGDVVEIHVRAIGRDAVAWLVSERRKVLVRADDVRGTGSEVIVYEAHESARLQIAFREASDRASRFEVSVVNRASNPPISDAVRAVTE